jgi:hypothetical protein
MLSAKKAFMCKPACQPAAYIIGSYIFVFSLNMNICLQILGGTLCQNGIFSGFTIEGQQLLPQIKSN